MECRKTTKNCVDGQASPAESQRHLDAGAMRSPPTRTPRIGQSRACAGTRGKWRSRPISRVLSWTVIPLGAPSPIRSSNLPGPDAGHAIRSLFGLAPGGVCRAGLLPDSRCALTAPFHPYHASRRTVRRYLSVALSVGLRRPGVTWHLALWSPDFPRHPRKDDATVWPTPPRALSHVQASTHIDRSRRKHLRFTQRVHESEHCLAKLDRPSDGLM